MNDRWIKIANQIASLDALTVVEGLSHCFDYVGREASLETMVKRSARILKVVFDVQEIHYFQLVGRGTTLRLESNSLPLGRNQELLDDKVRDQIETQLRLVNLGHQDYKQGINFLTLGPDSYSFSVLGESSSVWGILLWKEDMEPKSILTSDQHKLDSVRKKSRDAFIRQIQLMYRAYARFQKSQVMLNRDDLTGLYNHRYLEACLESEIRRVQRFKSSFSLLFIDLDNFKPINDSYGHLAGSQVLKQVADVLKDGLREVDSVFRYGGDEYVVLLLEANALTATRAAERIRQRIESTDFIVQKGQVARLTASIGVASCPEHGRQKEDLLRLADDSMYRSKRGGKNQVVVVGKQEISGEQLLEFND